MSKLDDYTSGLQHREIQARAEIADENKREIEGHAVPWGQVANLGYGITEEVERGAVDDEGALIFYAHREAIGKLVSAEDDDQGRLIRTRISETTLGNDALVLARDGVLGNWSIGFEPIEYTTREDEDGGIHITHTKIKVREISLVPLPAYDGAKVTNVREGAIRKETPMGAQNTDAPDAHKAASEKDVLELREAVEDVTRRLESGQYRKPAEPEIDKRSAGQVLKAIVNGDQATIDQYNTFMKDVRQERAYTGGTTADAIMKPAWVGDLTRLVDEAAPLLDLFSKGNLPATGMTIEYGQLKSNTVKVEKQENEGDNLPYGRVQVETKSAPVETFGGYGELSFQTVERSTVGIVDLLLRAQAMEAGKRMNASIRSLYATTAAAQTTAGNVIDVPALVDAAYADWIDALVDAAVKFEKLGLPITGMVTNTALFKGLGRLTASDGRPLLLVRGDGNNNIGEFNPTGLEGNLAGVTIRLDAGLTGTDPAGSFVNANAIRSYIDPVSRLQDENIINLSKQYSVYRYAGFAPEIPQAIVPVKFAAPVTAS